MPREDQHEQDDEDEGDDVVPHQSFPQACLIMRSTEASVDAVESLLALSEAVCKSSIAQVKPAAASVPARQKPRQKSLIGFLASHGEGALTKK